MNKRRYTDAQFIAAVSSCKSIAEVFNQLKLIPAGGNYKSFYKKVKELNLNTAHFTGQGHLKGKKHNYTSKIALNKVLVENSFYRTSALRQRLINELNWKNQCSICSISSWQNKTLVLHLDHINGINTDNRINNLRLLCPNCHSQTETYCAKNKTNSPNKNTYLCSKCNKQLRQKRKTGMCIKCCKLVAMVGLEPTSP